MNSKPAIGTLPLPTSHYLFQGLDCAVQPIGKFHTWRVKHPRHDFREVEHDDEAEEEAEQERGLESKNASVGEWPPGGIVPSIIKMLKVWRVIHFRGVFESCQVVEANCEGTDDLCVDQVQGEGMSPEICRDGLAT